MKKKGKIKREIIVYKSNDKDKLR